MANPQKEDGGVMIANELFDVFCRFRIPGEIRQVIDVIIRQTYGYNKKEDWISQSQIVKKTGLLKQNVWRSLKKGIEHRLVIKNDYKLRLNKNYEEWISFTESSKVITNKVTKDGNQKRLLESSKVITQVIKTEDHKIQYTKDNNTKYIPYRKVDNLLDEELLKRDYLNKVYHKYNVSFTDLIRKAEQIYNWAVSSKRNRRSDYKAVLRNALIKDFGYKFTS